MWGFSPTLLLCLLIVSPILAKPVQNAPGVGQNGPPMPSTKQLVNLIEDMISRTTLKQHVEFQVLVLELRDVVLDLFADLIHALEELESTEETSTVEAESVTDEDDIVQAAVDETVPEETSGESDSSSEETADQETVTEEASNESDSVESPESSKHHRKQMKGIPGPPRKPQPIFTIMEEGDESDDVEEPDESGTTEGADDETGTEAASESDSVEVEVPPGLDNETPTAAAAPESSKPHNSVKGAPGPQRAPAPQHAPPAPQREPVPQRAPARQHEPAPQRIPAFTIMEHEIIIDGSDESSSAEGDGR